MAVCKIGRETIERDTDTGQWMSADSPAVGDGAHDHDHEPAAMVIVERSHDDSESCVACAWGTNPAAYRIAGDVFVCADHLVTGVNIAIAYVTAKAN